MPVQGCFPEIEQIKNTNPCVARTILAICRYLAGMADTARQFIAFVDIKRWSDHDLAQDRSHLHRLPLLSPCASIWSPNDSVMNGQTFWRNGETSAPGMQ